VQIEGVVTHSDIAFRPRRQLRVTVDDGSDHLRAALHQFYPAHQKTLSVGARVRVRGEIRGGFVAREMIHPAFRLAEGDLPGALTPVYPTVAGLPQNYLRKAVLSGLFARRPARDLPEEVLGKSLPQPLWSLREALQFLHHPTPDVSLATLEDRSHPAWQRLKAEELLAQQLSQLQARRIRAAMRAPALDGPGHARHAVHAGRAAAGAPAVSLTAAQQRVCAGDRADLKKNIPMHRLLQGDVGAGKTVVAALAAAAASTRAGSAP
jgi:ATP-dependent DNA helicase RecG